MKNQNMSDIIESYLKEVLQDSEHVEIRRSEIADRFQCVPSQINYVINTRFTPQKGYVVESKRGGGGYIRIIKLNIVDKAEFIDSMSDLVSNAITLRDATQIINNLLKNEVISRREASIMHSAIDKDALALFEQPNMVRAIIFKNILLKLKYQ